jgi:hypothetical protein
MANENASEQNDKEHAIDDREPPLPDDGHELWDWKTKYDSEAWKEITGESWYLGGLLALGLVLLILNYLGVLYNGINIVQSKPELLVTKELYCTIFGFLGGTVYGIKILYKAVARGKWHIDRRLWRVFTPWVSLVLSIVIASIMSDTVLSINNYGAAFIGFFAGYFSEGAIGKLYAIAKIIFD